MCVEDFDFGFGFCGGFFLLFLIVVKIYKIRFFHFNLFFSIKFNDIHYSYNIVQPIFKTFSSPIHELYTQQIVIPHPVLPPAPNNL